MKNILILLLFALFTFSCVPPTRFKALQSESVTCQEERDQLKISQEQLTVENKELKARLTRTESDLAKAAKDTLRWKEELNSLNLKNMQLSRDYSDLQEAQQALLKGSEAEIRKLMTDLQGTQKDLQVREEELNRRNARLAELERVLQEQESVLTSLKKKVSDALLGFENQGLTIAQKNGKVYVSLDEKLLFKSGSTVVDAKGASALKNLSKVLEQSPDINIMIEGHTDDVPVIPGSTFKDNWDLSVLRATSIVRILLEGSSIDPQRLTTAGRSQYQPVDSAKTTEARQKNRRTEIILSPKLDELYKLVGN
jgi:chemotaxis protein MotB